MIEIRFLVWASNPLKYRRKQLKPVDVWAKLENQHLRFAVFHSAEMLTSLEKEYDARWNSSCGGPEKVSERF